MSSSIWIPNLATRLFVTSPTTLTAKVPGLDGHVRRDRHPCAADGGGGARDRRAARAPLTSTPTVRLDGHFGQPQRGPLSGVMSATVNGTVSRGRWPAATSGRIRPPRRSEWCGDVAHGHVPARRARCRRRRRHHDGTDERDQLGHRFHIPVGVRMVGNDGGVFVFPVGQSAGFYGSLPGMNVHVSDIVGIVATPGGGGYFLVGKDGGVFTFGNAPFFGSLPSIGVAVDNITGIASTPDGKGYYLVGSNGAVYAFGDAASDGSLPGLGVSVSNIVSIVPTPTAGATGLSAPTAGCSPSGTRPGITARSRGLRHQHRGGGADAAWARGTGWWATTGCSPSATLGFVGRSWSTLSTSATSWGWYLCPDGKGYWMVGSTAGCSPSAMRLRGSLLGPQCPRQQHRGVRPPVDTGVAPRVAGLGTPQTSHRSVGLGSCPTSTERGRGGEEQRLSSQRVRRARSRPRGCTPASVPSHPGPMAKGAPTPPSTELDTRGSVTPGSASKLSLAAAMGLVAIVGLVVLPVTGSHPANVAAAAACWSQFGRGRRRHLAR